MIPNLASEIPPASARWRAAGTIASRPPASTSVGAPMLQSRSEISNDFQLRQPLGHHPLPGLPDSVDHKVDQGAGLRLGSKKKVEKLIDEPTVAR